MDWIKLFDSDIELHVQTKTLPTKGNLVYEYNPLRNYRLSSNKYEYEGNLYSLGELFDKFKITIDISGTTIYRFSENSIYKYSTEKGEESTTDVLEWGGWIRDAYQNNRNAEIANIEKLLDNKQFIKWYGVPETKSNPILRERGELVDFITDELKVNLNHPVDIIPQYSYDGSVNLIINDGINVPKLINTRFSATGKNTYEIIDRKGNNDSNIYDSGDQFEVDTSLYKRITKIPKIKFEGVKSGGNLKIGNYHFYFKLADDDGNETDFFGESGLVSVFIGSSSYGSIHTGQKNQNSFKQIVFNISNIDTAYSYITVYYSRSTAEGSTNAVTEYAKIDKKYLIQTQDHCRVVITGFEEIVPVTVSDVNLLYNTVDAAKASATCQNMLFLGNVHKPDIPYEELRDLSLRFLPKLKTEAYNQDLDHNYSFTSTELGYIDPKFIYEKTGYWSEELYRLGIVYILPNNDLTPVFNIRGAIGIDENTEYSTFAVYNKDGERNYINYVEETNYIIPPSDSNVSVKYENTKGVISLASSEINGINSINIKVDSETIDELKKYVKGYFFVRQPRIPTILAQGITVGIDKTSRTPTLPVSSGEQFLDKLEDLKDSIVTCDLNEPVTYVSEGFLSRYRFKFSEKKNSLKITGKTALVALGVVALAASAVFTCGASLSIVAGVAIGAAGVTAVVGAAEGMYNSIQSWNADLKLNGINTKIPDGYELDEVDESRKLGGAYFDRLIIKNAKENMVQGIICPDYTLNQPYYNQIFTGSKHLIKTDKWQNQNNGYFNMENRHFYVSDYGSSDVTKQGTFNVIGVPENVKAIGLSDYVFRSRAGEAEEAWRYETVGDHQNANEDLNLAKNNTDIVRGIYSPYLAFDDSNNLFNAAEIVNIYIPNYQASQIENYINIRMNDVSSYKAISDRIALQDIDANNMIQINQDKSEGYTFNVYRGDCYICQFTQRLIRNFNDPSAPYNDKIVDENTWKEHYDPNNTEEYVNINLGDVNAVPLGTWVTFKLRSSNNLNIRTLDGSNIDESAMSGHERGFYPYYPMSVEGSYKIPDSQVYNKGFAKSLSERINVQVPDVPHIKNWFGTRIMYSDIHINDAYKNGFRVFQGTNYRDYTREYGEITKLVPFESSLLVIFEHGIAMLPVNERAVAGQGAGGNVYINTSNVLPENPMIISDMFGSQWPESVLKVPGKSGDAAQYVYGVDTVAKKIWRTDGQRLECISDMRVQEFLNNNITLGERELTPKIGIRNVKTVYNAFKRDVLFTFYDNTYGFEEKVWNLCWNELLEKFITFYSWVPSYMENINNIPFSFDRNVSKWIAKLGTSHTESSIADGITLSNVLTNNQTKESGDKFLAVDNFNFNYTYINKQGKEVTKTYTVAEESRNKFIGVLSLTNRTLPDTSLFYQIHYSLERDNYLNDKNFSIKTIKVEGESIENGIVLPSDAMFEGQTVPIYALKFKENKIQEINKSSEFKEVYYLDNDNKYQFVLDANSNNVYTKENLYNVESLLTELYYRNSAGHAYADYDYHKIGPEHLTQYLSDDRVWVANRDIITKLKEVYGDVTLKIGNVSAKTDSEGNYINANGEIVADKFGNLKNQDVNLKDSSWQAEPSGTPHYCTTLSKIESEIHNRNGVDMVHGIPLAWHWTLPESGQAVTTKVYYDLPIFKDITGKRKMLEKDKQLNPDKIVTLLNIKATISIVDDVNTNKLSDDYYNLKAGFASGTSLVDAGYYESVVAIAPKWNMQFLGSDFWKHGQAGLIDIADDIYPTYWYGKQHPFEFECIVVNDPSVHKIFDNLELVANKAKPESFHYEIIGEAYDFAKDKPNMYFRQEALKALWQYNGADITYDRNFLKVQPNKCNKSADLPHKYYARQDTINEIEDYYKTITLPKDSKYSYDHLSGAEIVYYPNRKEYRIWQHSPAVDLNDLSQDDARSILRANCQYLEDKWRITINPILVCYKNEIWNNPNRPKLPVMNSPIPDKAWEAITLNNGEVEIPEVLTNLGYNVSDIDTHNWLDGSSFGSAQNRKETDVRDKFMKVRIRYSGDELAIISFLNTIYRVSYA